jgi:catechol 2,3-dioxygenase-like lactoylglutathione lyase family enzyme
VPSIAHILETALYVDDIERAKAFYRDVLELHVMSEGPRLVSLDAGHSTVLLLFKRGATSEGLRFPGGWIPPHDGSGPSHFAFAIDAAEYDTWERQLEAQGVTIESRVTWSGGGRSIYFRDPDGHSVEMATPGVWPTY